MTRINRSLLMAGAAASLWLGVGTAIAGPCSAQLEQVGQVLNDPTGKGLGTLAGAKPGSIEHDAPMPQDTPAPGPTGKEAGTLAGASPDGKVVDPAGGKATSAQDVRLQQQGMPTMAQGGDPQATDDRLDQAKAAFERARTLDQQGDQGCTAALEEVQRLIRTGS